ncbi:ABC transporter permease [Paenibacillus popilliae]|uniref:ABC transporter permease n=1 Tax=Paenibacillus popilliae TaxID=78057 RepID=A0ABY3AR29_PAEPP|nr:ABC transporter permease [Paenibacillus sp. SDF0028]TQR45254.1 ABC transporter permease [Paenibacillus sp. SDF0028]
MILNRRIIRELKSNLLRYTALFFLMFMGLTLIIGLSASTDSITETVQQHTTKTKVEDGNFSLLLPLSKANEQELEAKGVRIEDNSYLTFTLADKSVLRVFKNRQQINLIELEQGKEASAKNEIVVEKHYAKMHGYAVGDAITFADGSYTITGIGSVPDYDSVTASIADVNPDPTSFSIVFVSDDTYDSLKTSNLASSSEELSYSYQLTKDFPAHDLKEYLTKMDFDAASVTNPYILELIHHAKTGSPDSLRVFAPTNDPAFGSSDQANSTTKKLVMKEDSLQLHNLTSFIQAEDNPRIKGSINDAQTSKKSAMIFGIIYSILISYIISVFVVHNIDSESTVIGALYALGYQKKDVLRHFLILPVIIIAVGGIAGTACGLSLTKVLSTDNIQKYSYPDLQIVISPYIVGYGIMIPIIISIIVNLFVINKKLSQNPLSLLRKEKKASKISHVDFGKMGFLKRFRLRQVIREARINISLFIGLSLAILIMVFGLLVYTSISHISSDITKEVKFNTMYFMKYPTAEVPPGGEEAYTTSLYAKSKYSNGELKLAIQGIKDDSPYYPFKVNKDAATDEIYASSSAAIKFGWNKGDTVSLSNHTENKSYTFKIKDIVQYGNGLYLFMNIDRMRERFEQNETYYNTVLSSKELPIDKGRLESVTTIRDIKRTGDIFVERMLGMIALVVVIGIILFIIVMFLLLKMTIDKSAFSISLMKTFGYTEKEVNKLYLGSNFYIVLLTAIIATPVCKIVIDKLFPYMVSHVPMGFNTTFEYPQYAAVLAIILCSYFAAHFMLGRHLKKVSLAEVLKNRE